MMTPTENSESPPARRGVLVYRHPDTASAPDAAKAAESMTIIKLKDFNTIIGRSRADIVISDDQASAPHCQLQQIGDSFQVFDMNSAAGTYVNGQRITSPFALSDGDIIRTGSTEFEFRWLAAAEVAELTSSQKTYIGSKEP